MVVRGEGRKGTKGEVKVSRRCRSARNQEQHDGTNANLQLTKIVTTVLLLSLTVATVLRGNRGRDRTIRRDPTTNATTGVLTPLPVRKSAKTSTTSDTNNATKRNDKTSSTTTIALRRFNPTQRTTKTCRIGTCSDDIVHRPDYKRISLDCFSSTTLLNSDLAINFSSCDVGLNKTLVYNCANINPSTVIGHDTIGDDIHNSRITVSILATTRPGGLCVLLNAGALAALKTTSHFLTCCNRVLSRLERTLPNYIVCIRSVPPIQPRTTTRGPNLTSSILHSIGRRLTGLTTSGNYICLSL